MTDPHRDPSFIDGPCQEFYLHHLWQWNGSAWTCSRCEKIAHGLRFNDTPCQACGKAIESVYAQFFCDKCLDACLDLDENYVPFEEVTE